LRVPAGREGVGDVARDDGDPRLRQVGHRAEPLDHRVQLRRLVRRDDLRAGRGEGELVGRVVLEEREADHDQEHRREPDLQDAEEHDGEDDVEEPEQRAREEHPQRKPPIPTERPAIHVAHGTRAEVATGTRAGGLSASLESRPVRRVVLIAALLLGAVVLAGCNSQGVATPTPKTVVGTYTTTTPTFPIVAAFKVKGDPAKGKSIFLTNCGSCHTLAAAKTSGTVGPNLDTLKPDYRAVTAQ